MQHIYRVEANDEEAARAKLADELCLPEYELKFVDNVKNKFKFEAITCNPIVEVEVSRDKMKAVIKRVKLPIGNEAPPLTTDFAIDVLKKKGIKFGIQVEQITEALFKITSDEKFNDAKPLSIVAAQGKEPVPAQAGRPQWIIDLKDFKKSKGLYARKGDLLAKAEISVQGQVGKNVFGEDLEFRVEDQFQLTVGRGIEVERTSAGIFYRTESAGQLFFDEGIRIRLEVKVIDVEEGLQADILIGKENFEGKAFNAKDLLLMAKDAGVTHGYLKPELIQKKINAVKKWPARIPVARGKSPVDGKPGEVVYVYKDFEEGRPLDKTKAELGIVFPGEVIARIDESTEPQEGTTVFGESLRGRNYNEKPLYPGKNVKAERDGASEKLIATAYGRVKKEEDRVHVQNILKISEDAMKVTMDLFPQKALSQKDVLALCRDKDVLFGYDEEKLATRLEQAHRSGKRDKAFVVAEGKPVTKGKSAKLRYYFKPDDLVEKGLFVKQQTRDYFAVPGDLLMIKFEPVDAEPGSNVYRERIEVSKAQKAADIKIESGRGVMEKELGKYNDPNDPLRVEYRSAVFGELSWANKAIDIKPAMEIDEKEDFFKLKLKARSDFGKLINIEMIEAFVQEEGVRVELEKSAIAKALKESKANENQAVWVEVAKSIPAEHGEDSQITYVVKFNNEEIDHFLESEEEIEVLFADCVRRKEGMATKTPAGNGKDGKSIFGRRINAERGIDLPWQLGAGVGRSEDGNSIFNELDSAGYVFVEDKRIHVRNTVEVSPDRMQAKVTIYPSKNPRFQPREDKISGMLTAKNVVAGVKTDEIKAALKEVMDTEEVREIVCAEGQPAKVGRPASHRFAFKLDDHAGVQREDGSVDYKAGGVYQMVKAGQLLMIKQEATRGADGFNVFNEKLSGQMGPDHVVTVGEGVRLAQNELEYYATRDGVVEFNGRQLRVIEGLMIPGNVDFSTGNVDAGQARVFIRGTVLSGFKVSSKVEIVVDKEVEACELDSGGDISVKGGIIGKEKAKIKAAGSVTALYINSGATVEAGHDITAQNELLNSRVYSGGTVSCLQDAGKVSGGEIWAFQGVACRVLGSEASEKETRVELGVNHLELQAAYKRIEAEGIELKIKDITQHLARMDTDLREMYEKIPEVAKNDQEEARELQETYKKLYEERKEVSMALETANKQKEVILKAVQKNKNFEVRVESMLHPGVVLQYEDVEWVIKEPLRGVVITWDESSRNFVTRQI